MEYRLYVFLINYKYLQDMYKKDLEIQFGNIREFLASELSAFDYEIEESDNRSLIFKNKENNDFANIFKLAKDAETTISRLRSLLKEFQGELFIKLGIITIEEKDKRHPFKWNFSYDEIKNLPNILLSDKTAVSIIENYDIKTAGIKNTWTTNGIEISRIQRIRKIYFNRDEENQIEEFIIKETNKPVLFIHGEIGSGKSGIINEVVKRIEDKNIIFLKEKKHSTKEFKIIHELIFNLMFVQKNNEILSIEEVIETIEYSSLPALHKNNLIYFVKNLFGDSSEEHKILFEYGVYRDNLKIALNDCIKINTKKYIIIIDDHQWMSRNCEEMILGLIGKDENNIRLILLSNDKNNSTNIKCPVKFLAISEINKVQISKLLQLTFPRTKIIGKTADFIHKATGGNLYTVICYIQFLIDKNALNINEGKLELKLEDAKIIPDNLSDIFTEKINALSENSLTLLKIISIIGEQFFYSDLDWLLHILNYPYDESLALKELEDKGIVEYIGDHYIIVEPSIMNDVYKTVKDSNRKLIHKLLAELFETKGYEDFGFKVFFHYYRAEDYEKLFSILPDLVRSTHTNMHFNALRNMIEISDKILFKLCNKENSYPIDLWFNNLMYAKWLFDKDDAIEHIKRFEKAIDYLIKNEKKDLALDLFEVLLNFYIESDKYKKFDQYLNTGFEIAQQNNSIKHQYKLSVINCIEKINSGNTNEAIVEFDKTEEFRKSFSEIFDDDIYLMAKALVLNIKNETRLSLDILKELLDKYSVELNFRKINSILKSLIELSLKTRDYKSAEDYCKFLLNSNKDNDDKKTLITGNLLLAKLYSYQNKFLQSISMLESIIDGVKDEELYFLTIYTLGSIYQFYNEKDMAIKTFQKALDKIKDPKSLRSYKANIKLALIYSFQNDFENASKYLKECKSDDFKLCSILQNITNDKKDMLRDDIIDATLNDLYLTDTKSEPDLVFETELVLLNFLFSKRKFIKCKELAEFMSRQVNSVEDFNLTLEYQKLNKSIVRNASKSPKHISNIRKVSPTVKKRVRNRRTN